MVTFRCRFPSFGVWISNWKLMNAVGVLDRGFVTAAEPVMEQKLSLNVALFTLLSLCFHSQLCACPWTNTHCGGLSLHWDLGFHCAGSTPLGTLCPFEIYNLEMYAQFIVPQFITTVSWHFLGAWNCVLFCILLHFHKSYLCLVVSDPVLINVSMVKQHKDGEQAFVVKGVSPKVSGAGVEGYYSAAQALSGQRLPSLSVIKCLSHSQFAWLMTQFQQKSRLESRSSQSQGNIDTSILHTVSLGTYTMYTEFITYKFSSHTWSMGWGSGFILTGKKEANILFEVLKGCA